MPRVPVQYRTTQKDVFKRFKQKYPHHNITYTEWASIIYTYNYAFRDYVLETGHKCRMVHGFGDFAITKWKPEKTKEKDGKELVALPIDWKKTREYGKYIFHMNFNTEGYKFRWKWFSKVARFHISDLWNFKPSRVSSRLLKHYLSLPDYQHKYLVWKT